MPDRINVEMIDDTMQDGYKDLKNKDYKSGLEKWDRAWTMIKTIVPSRITSVEEVDGFIPDLLTQFIINWCQDYEMEMQNAGLKDESYITKRMEYCREFRRLFPDSDELIIQNMIRGEAESCAMLGDLDAAERLFEEFIAEYPDDPWGYIGWGDLYARPAYSKVPKDLDRAERIYRRGLEVCSYDRDVVLHRLKSLEDERRDLSTGKKHEKRKKRWEDFGARAAPITDKKMEMDLIYHIRTGRCPYNELECTPANCIYGNEGMNRCPIHQGEAIE